MRVPSRMDRYKEETQQQQISRRNKNQELYKNIGSNTRYANFTDVTNANAIDLSQASKNYRTREGYHQMKEYEPIMPTLKVKKELDEFNYLYQDRENRVYDINSVLEEARKNREEKDDLEEKRKLKNTSYNILASLNPEELEKYRQEKVERPKESELKELIDTITSKTLAGEIDKATGVNLLSDLMATNVMDKVEKPAPEKEPTKMIEVEDKLALSKEILDKEQLEKIKQVQEDKKEEEPLLKGADSDFYTRSMDLSDKDFEMDQEFKEKKLPLPLKIILIIIVLAIIAVSAYFIWKNM